MNEEKKMQRKEKRAHRFESEISKKKKRTRVTDQEDSKDNQFHTHIQIENIFIS